MSNVRSSERRRSALILNSSQTKRPAGTDQWIVNTAAAVSWAIGQNLRVIASYGLNTYELVTAIAGEYGADVLLIAHRPDIVDESRFAELLSDFGLHTRRTEFATVPSESSSPKSWWKKRDRMAVEMADVILPVSINPDGKLSRILAMEAVRDKIESKFRVDYSPQPSDKFSPIPEDSLVLDPSERFDYITHWTHSFDKPWPDESSAEFYMSIVNSGPEYSHSALNTLRHVLQSRTLFGSSRHMRDDIRAVGFSELHPAEAVNLMKWRRRYVRPTFEPYGIAIEKSCAEVVGIRPVIYGNKVDYQKLSEIERPYFQSEGEKYGDWKPEREWRYIGDLDLTSVPPDRMKVIVRKRSEIERIAKVTSAEVLALTNED